MKPLAMKQLFTLAIFGTMLTLSATVQQIPLGSQYYQNMLTVNPAFTGTSGEINAFLMHRSQFAGVPGSPQTTYLTVDGPLNTDGVGLGLKLFSDVTSIITRNGISGAYSYTLKFDNDDHKLTFGVTAGIIDYSINYDQAVVRDLDDPDLYEQTVHRTVFSADAGIAYTIKKLQLGFAIPQFLSRNPRFRDAGGTFAKFDMDRHYHWTARYTFDINEAQGITFYPLVMVRSAFGTPVQFDVNAVADWKKVGWLGVTYHSSYAIAANIGVRFRNLSIGYAHDFGVSDIRKYTGTTDEFLLSYQFGSETKRRLEQHEKDIEELKKRTAEREERIRALEEEMRQVQDEIDSIQMKDTHFRDSLLQVIDDLDSLRATYEDEHPPSPAVDPIKEPTISTGAFRTHSTTEFRDEYGNPMPKGYYVVVGSFGVRKNAGRFRDELAAQGEDNVMITFHQSINIYNVYVRRYDVYPAAIAERQKQMRKYANTWVLKLE